jgi:hypothetical protein
LDNINIDLKGTGCEGVGSINLAPVQWQALNAAVNRRVANKGVEFLEETLIPGALRVSCGSEFCENGVDTIVMRDAPHF